MHWEAFITINLFDKVDKYDGKPTTDFILAVKMSVKLETSSFFFSYIDVFDLFFKNLEILKCQDASVRFLTKMNG